MDLHCVTQRVGDETVVALSGLADLSTAPQLHTHLHRAIADHAGERFVVDLDGTTAVDDAALGLLVGAAARARELGGDIELVCTNERLRARLTATRIAEIVTLRTSITGSTARHGDEPVTYTAVIFTSRRTDGDDEGYEAMAAQMASIAAQQPGYRSLESARGRDRLGITVSYWDTADDARAWKRHADHLGAQQLGRDRWYASYRVRIATVDREYSYDHAHVSTPTDTQPA